MAIEAGTRALAAPTERQASSLLEYLYACPICSHTDLRHYCRVPSLFEEGTFIRYERCRHCGTGLRNPRLPSSDRLAKYEEKVLPAEDKELRSKSQNHYAYMMRWIRRVTPRGGGRRLLDFGCGAGGFLVEARAAGFDVMGLELNRDLASHVETTYGIPVFQGLVSDPAFGKERFNVIISSQVFEHLLDPRRTLEELRQLLVPPGIMLIEVPSLHDVRERLRRGSMMDDSHLFYFTANSLSAMLREQGFRVVRREEGLRPYRFLGDSVRSFPLWALGLGQQITTLLQIRTGLSVIAMLDS